MTKRATVAVSVGGVFLVGGALIAGPFRYSYLASGRSRVDRITGQMEVLHRNTFTGALEWQRVKPRGESPDEVHAALPED